MCFCNREDGQLFIIQVPMDIQTVLLNHNADINVVTKVIEIMRINCIL